MSIQKRLEVSDRGIANSINEMIQGDVVKALVEFITNADDSYARLEAAGQSVSGRIEITVDHKPGGRSTITVHDDAEGFTPEGLDLKLARMGEDTSGLQEGLSVRGFFGNGLKEGILGLSMGGDGGEIVSVRDGLEIAATLRWKGKEPWYERADEPRKVSGHRRNELGLRGNGTRLTIALGPEIRVPRQETLVNALSLHFALRDIVQNPDRYLQVRRVGTRSTDSVSYRDPVEDPEFTPTRLTGRVPEFQGSEFSLEVRRAKEPLDAGGGSHRIGGLLVQSKRALLDVTFFGHENRPGTEHLFGRVVCDGLYEQLKQGQMVVSGNRTGLNKENPFVRALGREVSQLLAPIVEAEAKRLREGGTSASDPESRRRTQQAVKELNQILRAELGEGGQQEGEEGDKDLSFSSGSYKMWEREERVLRAFLRRDLWKEGEPVRFDVEGEGLSIRGDGVVLPDPAGNAARIPVEVRVEGAVPIESGVIRARYGALEASAKISVEPRMQVGLDFGFDSESYRIVVGRWTQVKLQIRASLLQAGQQEVTFHTERGEVQVRPEVDTADAGAAHGEWVTLRVELHGDRVGSEDSLVATMGPYLASAQLKVVAERQPTETGAGTIKDIRFNDQKENPPQRFIFDESTGDIIVFVNEPSIRRYLRSKDDRDGPVGRALAADLIVHAFCRYLASKKTELFYASGDLGDPVSTVLREYDKLVKQYGGKIHAVWNPPGGRVT
jgi:histidine kinase/DNA gyrase B/HSP90-like ATPase